jgi:hypothetical protein
MNCLGQEGFDFLVIQSRPPTKSRVGRYFAVGTMNGPPKIHSQDSNIRIHIRIDYLIYCHTG